MEAFESNSLESFWCTKAISYFKLREIALRYFMVFTTMYLCEQGFSAILVIKNKARNRLKVSNDLRVALSNNISPRVAELVSLCHTTTKQKFNPKILLFVFM